MGPPTKSAPQKGSAKGSNPSQAKAESEQDTTTTRSIRKPVAWISGTISAVENIATAEDFPEQLADTRKLHGPRYHVKGLIDIGSDRFTMIPSRLDNSLYCEWGCRTRILGKQARAIADDLGGTGWVTLTYHKVKDTVRKQVIEASGFGYIARIAFGDAYLAITNKAINDTSEYVGVYFETWLMEYGLATWERTKDSRLRAMGSANRRKDHYNLEWLMQSRETEGREWEEEQERRRNAPPAEEAEEEVDHPNVVVESWVEPVVETYIEPVVETVESWRRCRDRLTDNIDFTFPLHPETSLMGLDPYASSVFAEAITRAESYGFTFTDHGHYLESSVPWTDPKVYPWRRFYNLET